MSVISKVTSGASLSEQYPELFRDIRQATQSSPQRKGNSRQFSDIAAHIYRLATLYKDNLQGITGEPSFLAGPEDDLSSTSQADLPKQALSWTLYRREPAATSGPPFSQQAQSIKPRLMEKVTDSNNPDYVYTIYQQPWDTLIQFTLWAFTQPEVDALADWFENFLVADTPPLLERLGIQQSYVHSRFVDRSYQQYDRLQYKHQSFLFYVRTDTLYTQVSPVLKAVHVLTELPA